MLTPLVDKMSLIWNWKDKMGTMSMVRRTLDEWYDTNLYACNGLYVALHEYQEDGQDKYIMCSFAVDEKHFKNMLGLTKEYPNEAMDYAVKFKLNVAYKEAQKMAKILIDAQAKDKWHGTLETYRKENGEQ